MYWTLFVVFAKIGVMAFGGGYATLPLIHDATTQWLTEQEFVDLVTISQMTPGPIFLNAATFVGCKVTGSPLGGMAATLGALTPPCAIVTLLAFLALRYRSLRAVQALLAVLRPVVLGLIAAAAAAILQLVLLRHGETSRPDLLGLAIAALSLAALRLRKNLNPIFVMLAGGAIALVLHFLQ